MGEQFITEQKAKAYEIAEILAYLKKQGYVLDARKQGYLECLLSMSARHD